MAYNTPTLSQSEEMSAPWNERPVPECTFDLNVQVTLSRKERIKTNNYVPCVDDEGSSANTDDTDWVAEYKEKCYTIPELLEALEGYIREDIKRYKGLHRQEKRLMDMLDACQGWDVTETYVEEA